MTIKHRAEVPFTEAGEGCFLRFTLRDIAELEQIYGVGEYFSTIEKNLSEWSGTTLINCLTHGLKTRDDDGKYQQVVLDPDAFDVPVVEAFEPIMDALSLAAAGRTYSEMLAYAEEQMKALTEKAEEPEAEDGPLPDSGVSSDTKPSDTDQD